MAAKDKADYLLASVGEKLGALLNVNEIDNSGNSVAQYAANNLSVMDNNSYSSGSNINFKTIKLSFQVSAVFEIK